uniref:Tubulin--tyrosine ligase-like protein 9 n=1 Tax=Cebus imitator TaxID=2715852 RepID=A0A2K5QHG2_CEBIM
MSRPKMTSLHAEKTQRIYKLPELIIQADMQNQLQPFPFLIRAGSTNPVQDRPHEHTHGCPSPQTRMGGSEGDTRNSDDQKDDIPVENYVAQRYIENPYLIGGRKFDLRVYVLVMSYIPLRAWLYRDGFARFSNTRFTLNSIDDQCILGSCLTTPNTPTLPTLWPVPSELFCPTGVCSPLLSLPRWLLEVNASPSLTASSQEDYELKTCLLEDTLHVVDMEARLTGREKRVGGFDLMWNDGPVSREEGPPDLSGTGNFVTNTHLGCVNDRKKQLRQLFCSLQVQKKASN